MINIVNSQLKRVLSLSLKLFFNTEDLLHDLVIICDCVNISGPSVVGIL